MDDGLNAVHADAPPRSVGAAGEVDAAQRARRGVAKTRRILIKVAAARALVKPGWIRVRVSQSETFKAIKQTLRAQGLHTVCEEASRLAAVRDLRAHNVDMLTVGQYLQPRPGNLPVLRYAHPAQFDALVERAKGMGFTHAACGPLVRSSYHADERAIAAGL